ARRRPRSDQGARRSSADGYLIWARYLDTVRRATTTPWLASLRASITSERGSFGSSASIISWMSARTEPAEQVPPERVASSREKKCLNSNTPRGEERYLLLVARETVDSCMPSSSAISLSIKGRRATSP